MNHAARILFSLALLASSVSACEAGTKAKVLFIGKKPDHPFGSHMYLHTCGVLAKCLAHTEGVETVVSQGWPKDAALLEGVSTIVMYTDPAAEFLLDAPHRNEFTALMDKGVGLVTIHWASTVKKDNFERLGPPWMTYLGGTWISNVGLHTGKSQLKQLKADHPVCRGWEEYEIHDEYYLNPTITDAATPLLQVIAKDKPVIVGWSYDRPNGGRSFATTLGHYYENFQRERFRRMIVNGILWTAKVEIPAGGANVDLSKADLALPPKPKKKPHVKNADNLPISGQ